MLNIQWGRQGFICVWGGGGCPVSLGFSGVGHDRCLTGIHYGSEHDPAGIHSSVENDAPVVIRMDSAKCSMRSCKHWSHGGLRSRKHLNDGEL